MQVKASLNNLRVSPKKVRLVVGLVRGMDVQTAQNQLAVLNKGTAKDILKLINSAIANGEHNFGLDKNNLFIKHIVVGGCYTMKRWLPRAFGRASMIRKKTSRVNLILDEKIPTPEDKIKKHHVKTNIIKADDLDDKIVKGGKDNVAEKNKDLVLDTKTSGSSKGFGKRMFNRKSGQV